ncbi:MAG: hypothetical protein MZV63_31430 [Marinilabiliales bacterium]|nr:hypothetical protein [Marinilabiliales bacterium]
MAQLKTALAFSETGLFCQQCGQCLRGCRDGRQHPRAIMRSCMYAYGYGNLRQAREVRLLRPGCGRGHAPTAGHAA